MIETVKHSKIKLIVFLFICLWINGLQAQEAMPATGGNAVGTGGSVSYTIGQVIYYTSTGINGSVAQGVQNPFDISVVGLSQTLEISSLYSVYPNPTNNILILKIENFRTATKFYQLYDITGKLFDGKKLTDIETPIEMGYLIPSIYFLKIFQDNKEIQTFKIIKY